MADTQSKPLSQTIVDGLYTMEPLETFQALNLAVKTLAEIESLSIL